MRAQLVLALLFTPMLSVAIAQQERASPVDLVTLPSPDGQLVAITRTPVPDTEVPDYPDLDGTLLFIRGSARGDRIIARWFFAARFVSQILWSPDSQFLAVSTASAGGHSPWHFHCYFWSRSDRRFRHIDDRADPIVDEALAFSPPDVLTVKVAGGRTENGLDIENPVDRTVDLSELRRRTRPLPASSWP